jgi:hypothetical protein
VIPRPLRPHTGAVSWWASLIYVVVMIALIVTVDILFLRAHGWLRLAVNAGIVAVFAVVYLVFLRR